MRCTAHLTGIGLLSQNNVRCSGCSRASIASHLVATTDHLRQLLYSRVDPDNAEPGLLASGWRRALLGDRLERLLGGQTAIRIGDLRSPEPVRICEV